MQARSVAGTFAGHGRMIVEVHNRTIHGVYLEQLEARSPKSAALETWTVPGSFSDARPAPLPFPLFVESNERKRLAVRVPNAVLASVGHEAAWQCVFRLALLGVAKDAEQPFTFRLRRYIR